MKKFVAILLTLVLVLSLAACSPQQTEQKKIGGLLATLSFDFQIQMNKGLERAAKENGYEYVVYDYNCDSEQMLTGLETLASSNVGAMYALYLAPESAADFMKSHQEIGFLTQGAPVDGCQAWTENDYVRLGKQFVEALENYVNEHNLTSGTISAMWLEGCDNRDSDYYTARLNITEEINKWCEGKDFTFSGDYYPRNDEEAANFTAQQMNADPNTRIIFAFNNGYAVAAANEIASAVKDTSEYFVFSSEGDPESFRLIADGNSPYRACAYANIEESGYQVGLQCINWIENGKMENVVVVKDLVDSRNVADYLE